MPFFRWLIGKKAGIFALFQFLIESIASPKPSPVGEGVTTKEWRMRCPCALNNPSITASSAAYLCTKEANLCHSFGGWLVKKSSYPISSFDKKQTQSLPLEGKVSWRRNDGWGGKGLEFRLSPFITPAATPHPPRKLGTFSSRGRLWGTVLTKMFNL